MSWYISFSLQKRFDRKREHIWDKKYTVFLWTYNYNTISDYIYADMQPLLSIWTEINRGQNNDFLHLFDNFIYIYVYIYINVCH